MNGHTKEAGLLSSAGNFVSNHIAPLFSTAANAVAKAGTTPMAQGARAASARFGAVGGRVAVGGVRRGDMVARATARAAGTLPQLPKDPTNTFGHLAWNGIRGALGFGAQERATGLAKVVAPVANAAMVGAPIVAGAFSQNHDPNSAYQQGMQVTASDRSGVYTVKTAFDPEKIRAGVDLASYGALAAPLAAKLIAPKFYEQHHGLMHGLDVAGLAGLTGTGVYGMATGKRRSDRVNDAMDVGGLGLMGLALHRRLSEH